MWPLFDLSKKRLFYQNLQYNHTCCMTNSFFSLTFNGKQQCRQSEIKNFWKMISLELFWKSASVKMFLRHEVFFSPKVQAKRSSSTFFKTTVSEKTFHSTVTFFATIKHDEKKCFSLLGRNAFSTTSFRNDHVISKRESEILSVNF